MRSILFFLVVRQIDAHTYKEQPEDETGCELLAQDNKPRDHSEKRGEESEHRKLGNRIGVDELEPRQVRSKGHDDRGIKKGYHGCSVYIYDPFIFKQKHTEKNDG